MFDALRRFFISADFYKSLTFSIGALLPILISEFCYDNATIGFAIALGVFYNSPTNVAGSVRHRTYGMLIAICLTTLATLIMGYAVFHLWVLLSVLGCLTFLISYLSVFGFRASLVSFAGLLAVVISFGNSYVQVSVLEYALLIGAGGVWYLFLASFMNYINPRMYVEELLSDTLELTAKYLEVRAKLLTETEQREQLTKQLFDYQAQLSEKHETLRAVILTKRQKSGVSNRIRRKLLIFIELVDMLELAIANPIDYQKLDELFKDRQEQILPFVDLILEMVSQLDYISKVIIRGEKPKSNSEIRFLLKKIRTSIDAYKEKIDLENHSEGFYILVHLFEYQAEQAHKIKAIERALTVISGNNSLKSFTTEDAKFLTPQDYGFNKLKENFSFKSSIFRHSLRLSIVMVVGFLVGELFSFQNPYWILITLLVIMRPSYGLTKKRMQQRVVGTLIGAVIALVVVLLIQNTVVFAVLAALTLALALALVQLNYRIFAVFLTLHIVFLYAVYSPDVIHAVQFRVIDTLVGAALAFLSNLFLFPAWEFMSIEESVEKVLKGNCSYLKQIDETYHTKKEIDADYKLARKQAFLAIGDLNAAFQRMTQEPKSRQKYFDKIYEIVVSSNTFLSSLASLGTFVRTHKTTTVSVSVETFVENILGNLENGIALLQNKKMTNLNAEEEIQGALSSLEKKYDALTKDYDTIELKGAEAFATKENLVGEIQEAKLVLEQMSYLFTLSKNMINQIKEYQLEKQEDV
ncbi:FUSC family protein [Flavicella sediminum]|uniref:FUSC family protein n=1 Tax=Flavicella sediminum TaxID=2585141 RepID=UPI001123C221|nr:FUSC family membrane protein [Flavicella sediminum]